MARISRGLAEFTPHGATVGILDITCSQILPLRRCAEIIKTGQFNFADQPKTYVRVLLIFFKKHLAEQHGAKYLANNVVNLYTLSHFFTKIFVC